MDYISFFKEIYEGGIECVVSGGVALTLHGVPRLTYDLDLIVDFGGESAGRLAALLPGHGYRTRDGLEPRNLARADARRRWRGEGRKALKFVGAEADLSEIDIALETTAPFADLKARALTVTVHGTPVTVLGLDDIVALKKAMGRDEDAADLKSIALLGKVAGTTEELEDRAAEQMRKFHFWPVDQRVEWLLTGSQLRRQTAPDSSGGKGLRGGRRGLKKKKIPGLRHTDLS